MTAVDTSILVTPVVSWPRRARPGNRYLVTVDLRRTRPADEWPYDEEEFAFGCAVDGGRYFTAACFGETSLILHRFGGTYGPVRFIVQAGERVAAPVSTALWLTLTTEGGVALPAVELPVQVDADAEDRPEDLVEIPVGPGAGVAPESGARAPSGGPPYLVQLLDDSGSPLGDGVLVTRRLVATCDHVVPDTVEAWLRYSTGERIPGRVLWREPTFDVAILQLTEQPTGSITPAPVGPVLPGDPFAFAVRAWAPGRWVDGEFRGGRTKDGRFLLHFPPESVTPGTSGTGVVDERTGTVIGLIASRHPGGSEVLMVPLLPALRAMPQPPSLRPPRSPLSPADLRALARELQKLPEVLGRLEDAESVAERCASDRIAMWELVRRVHARYPDSAQARRIEGLARRAYPRVLTEGDRAELLSRMAGCPQADLVVAWRSANADGYSGELPDFATPAQIVDSLDHPAQGGPPVLGFAEMLAALTEGERSARLAEWATRVYERLEPTPRRDADVDPADLVRASAGDQAAWDEIVRRNSDLVAAVARSYRLSDADVDDVSQSVWLRLLEHLPEIREPAALRRWITTTTRRESVQRLRAAGHDVPADLADLASLVDEEAPDVDRDLLATERHAEFESALAALTPRERDVLRLVASDPPVPYAEISKRLGIPVGSIGPTRARALNRLSEIVAQQRSTGARPGRRLRLVFRVEPFVADPSGYLVSASVVSPAGRERLTERGADGWAAAVAGMSTVANQFVAATGPADRVSVEFVLPVEWLSDPVEQNVRVGPAAEPIGLRYPVVVRPAGPPPSRRRADWLHDHGAAPHPRAFAWMDSLELSQGLAGLLSAWRAAAGLTQRELAGRAGVGIATISEIENGWVKRPRPGTAARLADALGLDGPRHEAFVAAARGSVADAPRAMLDAILREDESPVAVGLPPVEDRARFTAAFEAGLAAGVPIMLWTRRATPPGLLRSIVDDWLGAHGVAELPDLVLRLRRTEPELADNLVLVVRTGDDDPTPLAPA